MDPESLPFSLFISLVIIIKSDRAILTFIIMWKIEACARLDTDGAEPLRRWAHSLWTGPEGQMAMQASSLCQAISLDGKQSQISWGFECCMISHHVLWDPRIILMHI